MANYGRDTGEAYSDTGSVLKAVGATILTGIVGLSIKCLNNINNINKKLDIQNQIADCDRQINEHRSGLLGSFRNRKDIEAEKEKRADLRKKYDKIRRGGGI